MAQGDVGIYASQISGHLWAPSGAYDALSTVTLTATTASISFAGIPQGYKHLELRGIARATDGTDWRNIIMKFNSDSGANYSLHYVDGSGSSAAAGGGGGQSNALLGFAGSDQPAPFVTTIFDYSNTSKNKVVRSIRGVERNTTPSLVSIGSNAWFNLEAITQIGLTTSTGSFAAGTSIALYGVK